MHAIQVAASSSRTSHSSTCACPAAAPSATRGIKRSSPHTSVLAFSAHDDELTMQEMYAAGADGYIVKGSKVTAIITSIRDAAEGSRMRRAA